MSELDNNELMKHVGDGLRKELREDKEFAKGILCYILYHHNLLDFETMHKWLNDDMTTD